MSGACKSQSCLLGARTGFDTKARENGQFMYEAGRLARYHDDDGETISCQRDNRFLKVEFMGFGRTAFKLLAGLVLATSLQACQSAGVSPVARTTPASYAEMGHQGAAADATSGMVSAYASGKAGSWTISDNDARTNCAITLTTEILQGAAMKAIPAGYCSMDYDDIGGWIAQGDTIILTNHTGAQIGLLRATTSGAYSGHFDAGYFGAGQVTMSRSA